MNKTILSALALALLPALASTPASAAGLVLFPQFPNAVFDEAPPVRAATAKRYLATPGATIASSEEDNGANTRPAAAAPVEVAAPSAGEEGSNFYSTSMSGHGTTTISFGNGETYTVTR